MQQWTRIKEDEAEHDLSLALVVDAELFRLDCGRPVAGRRRRPPQARRHADPPRASSRSLAAAAAAGWGCGDEHAGAAGRVEGLRRQGAAEVHALREVDLSVEPGAMVAVMGPSGSGKSTLLTIAGSLEEPTSGEVLVDGAALSGMSRNDKARLRRRTIGYVFQDFNLLAGLTAAENVALPLELDGVSARKARAAGLRGAGGARPGRPGVAQFPDELSGGERQRVAIARAVVGERHLLLADEPSGALDSVNAEAVMRLLHEACKRGVAAVVVTHDAQLASWADRVVFLRDGRRGRPDRAAAGPGVAAHAGPGPVSTALRERPARAGTGNGGVPARRAVIRWAWRLFRREWRQQLLVLALIMVAVAATVVGAAVATNTPPPADAGFGTAHDLATFQAAGPHLAGQIAALQHRVRPGRRDREPDRRHPRLDQHLRPARPEPARPVRAADALPGQRALPHRSRPGGRDRRRGLRLQPQDRRRLAPGRHGPAASSASCRTRRACWTSSPSWRRARSRAPTQVTVLFDAPGVSPASIGPNVQTRRRHGVGRATRSTPRPSCSRLATVGMLLIALVAVGGFTVLAQRRLRSLGMLGVAGRHRQERPPGGAGQRRRGRRGRRADRGRARPGGLAGLPAARRGRAPTT